jgi:hypothetical protein
MLTDHDYELLSEYLDDALNAAERADLETRLKAESELRRELEALRGTVALVKSLPLRKAPRNFTLDASMARRPAPRRAFFSPTLVSALSAAAAVLLIGFGLLSLTTSSQNAAPLTSFGAAQQSPVEEQGGAALLPTEAPVLKTSDGSLAATTASEAPIAPPQPGEPSTETGTNDLLNQPSGGGGEPGPTRDQQEQQTVPSPAEAQVNAAAQSQATAGAPPLLFAPAGTAETAQGFSALAPSTANGTTENYNAQTAQGGSAAQSDQAALAATEVQTIERAAPTATLTETVQPTLTETPPPSDTPTPAPVAPPAVTSSASPPTNALPLLSVVLGLVLLVLSLIFYLRSRRKS